MSKPLKTVEQLQARRDAAKSALTNLMQSPFGSDVLWLIESELGLDQLVGVDTHDTYFNLGKKAALDIIAQYGETE